MSDRINPDYYQNKMRHWECGQAIECNNIREGFPTNLADAIKYIWRCGSKGDPAEELDKAIWYLRAEKDRIDKKTAAREEEETREQRNERRREFWRRIEGRDPSETFTAGGPTLRGENIFGGGETHTPDYPDNVETKELPTDLGAVIYNVTLRDHPAQVPYMVRIISGSYRPWAYFDTSADWGKRYNVEEIVDFDLDPAK